MRKSVFSLLALLVAVLVIIAVSVVMASPGSQTQYNIKATKASLQREVTGTVTSSVQGVPASPVDSFVYNGEGSVQLTGAVAHLEIDPVNNTGRITVQWSDENGKWKLVQEVFMPPDHPSGLIVGPSSSTVFVSGDPITTNVYLHGNTTAGGGVLPTVFNLLATWGPAKVTLNGKPFDNPYDETPLWATHTMLTVGVRGDDGTVRNTLGGIFSPGTPENGAVDYDDLELHVVFHDAMGPMVPGNFPPPFSFFYHLTFEDVTVDISHIN